MAGIGRVKLEDLPKETLIKLVKLYSRNWITVDGLWFQNVEDKWGLEAAVEIDFKMWKVNARVEAQRVKEALGDVLDLYKGGLFSIFKALNFITWQPAQPFFEVEELSESKLILSHPHCPMQEGRLAKGRPELPCKEIGIVYFEEIAKVFEPRVKVKCLLCPPDPHPPNLWCKWELMLGTGEGHGSN